MARYWVVGGEYTDTNFSTMAEGKTEERHGPYPDYEAARKEWQRLAMSFIDDACVRYTIEKEESSSFWVVGGVYTDTSFTEIVEGGTEERFGPYDSYDAAKQMWQTKAWAGVDDANCRYRIEQL
ncbi:MAG: DUF4170 domain-containing protein [Alphaproteobacteria bacterium]|nr:DUF4170 domain-containing protein [Alphaproteobacteria bacterium]